ncbi:MAG: hypothetical protein KDG89_11430 [Geminicoccaceae bacterium]|nr:hypothetical protein [Geminicoccaceae bacterium]
MSSVRVVSTKALRERLREVLGGDSLLFQRFETALREHDDALVGTAMDSLRLYPEAVRREVQETLLAWLFDDDASGLADLPAASEQRH